MINLLIFDELEKEKQLLMKYSKDAVAAFSDDQLSSWWAQGETEIQKIMKENDLLDAGLLEIKDQTGINIAKKIRKAYELSQLLLIADRMISPMEYMIPEIRAASLLIRPFSKEQSKEVIIKFFDALYHLRNTTQEEKKLLLESREGKTAIPYSKIYYIEVSEKKIHVRLREKEYSQSGTMESMMKKLPKTFLRCHRSFAVNTQHIVKVKLSVNTVFLEDNIMVPLSRSYKKQIKQYMKEFQG